jgi:hypothetical protein
MDEILIGNIKFDLINYWKNKEIFDKYIELDTYPSTQSYSSPILTIKAQNSIIEDIGNKLLMYTCGHFGNVFRYMGAINISGRLNSAGREVFLNTIEEVE